MNLKQPLFAEVYRSMGELWHEGSQQDLAKPVGDLEEKWKLVPAFLQV